MAAVIRPKRDADAWMLDGALLLLGVFLLVFIGAPLLTVAARSFHDRNDAWVGLANYLTFLETPALSNSIGNSARVAGVSTLITVILAFAYAFAVTRTRMPGKGVFKLIAQIPILAPSLLPGIAEVYLFGNQGPLRGLLMGESIYGPLGIVMGEVFYAFPHAMMILIVALSTADARLYEAAESLGAGPLRRFFTITLPGARYGLVSAVFVVFTLVVTDFGVPKVVGGRFNVLATDVYKQVVGQQNFGMGAVIGIVLLIPAVLAFFADWMGRRGQNALLSARSVPYLPPRRRWGDRAMLAVCCLIAVPLIAVPLTAAFASLVTYWPYDLTPSLKSYAFGDLDETGWASYSNSLLMSGLTAVFGTVIVFTGAYLIERGPGSPFFRGLARATATLPLAVPGMVLGLAYIFFFNSPANPLSMIYGTTAILVLSTITHFYTVGHLTAVTAIKQLDGEFEAVSASLRVPVWRTFLRVTVPLCLPAVLDIAIYYFVNAMTTVSAIVFLYSPDTKTASIAVLNMDDAGEIAGSAAMAMMIVITSLAVRIAHAVAAKYLSAKVGKWRARGPVAAADEKEGLTSQAARA